MGIKGSNFALKNAREARGWSQAMLARLIGTDGRTVGRWERGKNVPSPYFRAQLCELFALDAIALGFVQPTGREESVHLFPSVLFPAPGPIFDPSRPRLSADRSTYIGRDTLVHTCVQILTKSTPCVLTGLPGIGKTTLAQLLVEQGQVEQQFPDGLLWINLGPVPQIERELRRLAQLLQVSLDQQHVRSFEGWSQLLHQAIGNRRMLIVLDDVWTIEAALPFLIGSNTSHLLTTRLPKVAFAVPGGSVQTVSELDSQQSRLLVEQIVPHLHLCSEELVMQVLHACGGLPLTLTLVGRGVRLFAAGGQRRRLEAALEHFILPESRLRLKLPYAPLAYKAEMLQETGNSWSLEAVIGQSEQQLSSDAREALCALSVLPTKPICFSETAALFISGRDIDTLDCLLDVGLLERAEDGWYCLHQSIGEYARLQQEDRESLKRLIRYGVQVCTSFYASPADEARRLDSEYPVLLAALEAAKALQQHQELIQMVLALVPFLCAQGLYMRADEHLREALAVATGDDDIYTRLLMEQAHIGTLCESWEQARRDALAVLDLTQGQGQPALQAACLECLGLIAQRTGELAEARAYYEAGLQQARSCTDSGRICTLLTHLGNLECDQGWYQQALTFLQEALTLARQEHNLEHMSLILADIGNTLQTQGKHQQAESVLREGLTLARHLQQRTRQIHLLGNLAGSVLEQGDATQAEELLLEGLALAHQAHEKRLKRLCLLNLGCVALERQEYSRAEEYVHVALVEGDTAELPVRIMMLITSGEIQTAQQRWPQARETFDECLKLAYDLGDPWLLGNALRCYAEMYLRARQTREADRYFQEALAVYRDYESNLELVGDVYFGLAQVAALQDKMVKARDLAKQSLRTFLDINHRSAQKVRAWLDLQSPQVVENEEKMERVVVDQVQMDGTFQEQEITRCPACSATHISKRGKGSSGRQRYLCQICHRAFTESSDPFLRERQWLARQLIAQGHSLRSIARQLGVSRTTVRAWITPTAQSSPNPMLPEKMSRTKTSS